MGDSVPTPTTGKPLPFELERLAFAPLLPIEAPLVQSVRSLEAVRGQAEVLLLLLEQMPGEAAQIGAALESLASHGNAAIGAVTRFQRTRDAEGGA